MQSPLNNLIYIFIFHIKSTNIPSHHVTTGSDLQQILYKIYTEFHIWTYFRRRAKNLELNTGNNWNWMQYIIFFTKVTGFTILINK